MTTEQRERGAGAWGFLDRGFVNRTMPQQFPTWDAARRLAMAREDYVEATRAKLIEKLQVAKLDAVLKLHGGDPLRDDWREFRPLAIGREEAWSDWLAYLLRMGDAELLLDLFGLAEIPAGGKPEVSREVVVPEDLVDATNGHYRADILITWVGFGIHLEVKIGDPHMRKTWDEAATLRLQHGGEWRHFLLMVDAQRSDFDRIARAQFEAGGLSVSPLTWRHVAGVFRRAMLRSVAVPGWLGLARTFTGAVEQVLLSRPWLGGDVARLAGGGPELGDDNGH